MGPFETYVTEKYFLTRSLSATTETHYEIVARSMDQFLQDQKLAKYNVKETNPDLISKFVRFQESLGSSRNTVRSKRRIVIAIVNHSLESEQRSINSKFVRNPKPQMTLKDSWTPQQVAILIQVAGAIPGTLSKIGMKRGDYAAAMIAVCFETAARRGDLTRIRTKDAMSGKPFQFVQGKTQHVTTFRISEATVALIRQLHGSKKPALVFPPWGKYYLDSMTGLARAAMRRAGLEASDGCLKKLRRSSITEAERLRTGTGFLQAGHTTPEVTMSNYIDQSRAYQDIPRPSLPTLSEGGAE